MLKLSSSQQVNLSIQIARMAKSPKITRPLTSVSVPFPRLLLLYSKQFKDQLLSSSTLASFFLFFLRTPPN